LNSDDKKLIDEAEDEFSLESILAEYKGSAFINSEKRTPKALLNEQAENILKEASGDMAPNSLFSNVDLTGRQTAAQEEFEPPAQEASEQAGHEEPVGDGADFVLPVTPVQDVIPVNEVPAVNEAPAVQGAEVAATAAAAEGPDEFDATIIRPEAIREELDATLVRSDMNQQKPKPSPVRVEPRSSQPNIIPDASVPVRRTEEKDSTILFFDNFRKEPEPDPDAIVRDVEKAIEKELGHVQPVASAEYEDGGEYVRKARFGFDDDELLEDEFEEEEPELKEAASRFALACNSISLRCVPAAIISIVMVILTFAFEGGLAIPFGVGHDISAVAGMLLVGLLLVSILCVDILTRGVMSLIRGAPNAETLIVFSCVFSLISAIAAMFGSAPLILPYCTVSAVTLTFAAFGEKFNLSAITETLKSASGSSEPYGVQAEYYEDIDKSVLKKAYKRTDGFYTNLMHPDISELIFRYAAPVLLAAALLLTLLTTLVRGGEHFLMSLSATFAAAAPFSLLLAFSIPFGTVAKAMRRSGAAIAGWGGADDVCFTDGAGVTDEDIFPSGTLSLSGMKLFDGAPAEKAIRYTSSLITASGSVLTGLFDEVLKTQGLNTVKVDDFEKHEGGISAMIRGELVATGSGAFMNLLGVRVPDDTNIKSAVYTAINKRLVAMFTVEYVPINSVQAALISLHTWRIKMFFAVRDFNITPLMIEQKFRVPLDNFEFVQAKESYEISDLNSGRQGRMAAVLTREGLGPFAEAVTGGRLLKSSAFVATLVSAVSAGLGVLIMFYMFWSGAVLSARPGNLLLFMAAMLAAVLIVCGYVRCKK